MNTSQKIRFTWTLEHFCDGLFEKGDTIESPGFRFDHRVWKVIMNMNGSFYWNITVRQTTDHSNSFKETPSDCLISILNSRNEVIRSNGTSESLIISCDDKIDYLSKDGTLIVFVELNVKLLGLYRTTEDNVTFNCTYVVGKIPEFQVEFLDNFDEYVHTSKFHGVKIQWTITKPSTNDNKMQHRTVELKTAINKFQIHWLVLGTLKKNVFTNLFLKQDLILSDSLTSLFTILPRYVIKEYPLTTVEQAKVKDNNIDFIELSSDLRNYSKFLENKNFSDVIINVEDKTIYAHKIILAKYSSRFEEMVERENTIINITDYDFETIDNLIQYIYSGETKEISGIADKLLHASNTYGNHCLKTRCEKILIDQISMETAIKLYILAEKTEALNLKEAAIAFYANNAEKLMKSAAAIALFNKNPELARKLTLSALQQSKE